VYLPVTNHRRPAPARRAAAGSPPSSAPVSNVDPPPVPSKAPPHGFLTFSDALEALLQRLLRGPLADRLKTEGSTRMGESASAARLTKIGLTEVAGRIPNPEIKNSSNWRLPPPG